MKKILIVYATAGMGHKKAAQAIKAAFDEAARENTEIRLIDALDYTSPFFKWFYLQSYIFMVSKTPTFWGLFYYLTNNPVVDLLVRLVRRFNNDLNSKALREYLLSWKPDVIISTHFFASEIIGDMKEKGLTQSRLITVVTDYRMHLWWIDNRTDIYVVGSSDARGDLLKLKVDESRIKVLGIPIEPIFSKPIDAKAVIDKTGLDANLLTILVIGGGYGVGPIEAIVRTMNSVSHPMQIIVICGHNEALVKRLEALRPEFKHKLVVFGFMNNVYEYMEIADLLISKSGGVTVSESLTKELPMMVISPIIGQETRNCEFIVSSGAAIEVDNMKDLREALEGLAAHPERLAKMRKQICKIKKPQAASDVVKLAIDIVNA